MRCLVRSVSKKKGRFGARLDANDMKVMSIVASNEHVCKADAPEHGMAVTTFQNHAKKLVAMGLLKETIVDEREGYPKTIYEVVSR